MLDSQSGGSGSYYTVDIPSPEDQMRVVSNKPNTFELITVERSAEEVSIDTDIKFCLTPRNPIP